VLTPDEARKLLDSIDVTTVVGLRDGPGIARKQSDPGSASLSPQGGPPFAISRSVPSRGRAGIYYMARWCLNDISVLSKSHCGHTVTPVRPSCGECCSARAIGPDLRGSASVSFLPEIRSASKSLNLHYIYNLIRRSSQ
jgi:hypothetical protein